MTSIGGEPAQSSSVYLITCDGTSNEAGDAMAEEEASGVDDASSEVGGNKSSRERLTILSYS